MTINRNPNSRSIAPFVKLLVDTGKLAHPAMRAMRQRILSTKPLPKDHPFHDLKALKNNVVQLSWGKVDLGTHFFPYGGEYVKGMNLCVRDKGYGFELRFDLNHVHRAELQKRIDSLAPCLGIKSYWKAVEQPKDSHLTEKQQRETQEKQLQDEKFRPNIANLVHEFTWNGVGRILTAQNPDGSFGVITREVVVELPKNTTAEKIQKLLAVYGLEGVLRRSTQNEIERMKIGHLFRVYFPSKATPFERIRAFFDLSIPALKQRVIKLAPLMKTHFKYDLPEMKPVEILPGKFRYSIPYLSTDAQELGVRALRHSTRTSNIPDILKSGLLSAKVTQHGGGKTLGFDAFSDWAHGSSDSTFFYLITHVIFKQQESLTKEDLAEIEKEKEIFGYEGSEGGLGSSDEALLIVSREALKTGPYAKDSDCYGSREEDEDHLERPSLKELIEKKANNPNYVPEDKYDGPANHEVMIKDRVGPEYIIGCVVSTETKKQDLIKKLKANGVIKNGAINGIPADKFIHVGTQITKEMVASRLKSRL